ncbi:MAG: GGDEF domain-containing protein [Hyphomicrobiales bacterium]|nr:GGDEF domain-containing protein [Hyphomicrobiales bacterium]
MNVTAKLLQQTETDKLKNDIRRLCRLLREAETEIARLEPLVDLDPLVPLFNRRAFTRELDRVVSYCKRYGTTAVLVYFDLDGFKSVNDRFGHAAGDVVLKQITDLLAQSIRKSDIAGRLGGDEFGVLLVRTDAALASVVVNRINSAIAETPVMVQGQQIEVTASSGLALVDGSDDAASVIRHADEAMYAARQRSRFRR